MSWRICFWILFSFPKALARDVYGLQSAAIWYCHPPVEDGQPLPFLVPSTSKQPVCDYHSRINSSPAFSSYKTGSSG
jgi:hypothetical protein